MFVLRSCQCDSCGSGLLYTCNDRAFIMRMHDYATTASAYHSHVGEHTSYTSVILATSCISASPVLS